MPWCHLKPSKARNGPKNGPTLRTPKPAMAKASKKKQTPKWVRLLRESLKASYGKGWIVREHRGGRTQISRAFPDGSRSSVTVGIQWVPGCQEDVAAMVSRLDRHIKKGQSLARAAELCPTELVSSPHLSSCRCAACDGGRVVAHEASSEKPMRQLPLKFNKF